MHSREADTAFSYILLPFKCIQLKVISISHDLCYLSCSFFQVFSQICLFYYFENYLYNSKTHPGMDGTFQQIRVRVGVILS